MGRQHQRSRISKRKHYLQNRERMMECIRMRTLGNKSISNASETEIPGCEYTQLQNVMSTSCKDVEALSFHEQRDNVPAEDNLHIVGSKSETRVYVNKKKQLNKKKLIGRRGLSQSIDNRLYKNDAVEGGEERRIVDIFYFISQLQSISDHSPFGCGFGNLTVQSEQRVGLMSKILFKCNMCHAKFTVNTCDPKPKRTMDVNAAAVSGMTPAGIGLAQLSEFLTAVNIPLISKKLFTKKNVLVSREWEKCALVAMEVAAERERQAAIEEGCLQDGVAVIDVIADGCWSKRSYRSNYTALSGAAAIIGRRFGEVLYLGVKNKYCCICARAENRGILPKEHACYKNYTGPSTGMEAEILVEGFKTSVESYNLIYGRLIADGDSSTYHKLIQTRPYPNYTIEKIECRNHLLRNMCNKLSALTKDTKYPLHQRKMITIPRILAIRKVICHAIREHKQGSENLSNRINKLYEDVSNSYNHAFSEHDDCKSHYCQSDKQNENLVKKLSSSSLWCRVQFIVGIVASNARSLIHDVDSNRVETFNSIIAKFVGGKRVNYSLRQTYQSRCSAAVVSFNTKRPIYSLQKAILGHSPRSKAKEFADRRIKKNLLDRKYLRRKLFNKSRIVQEDKHYGDQCQKPDLVPEQLQQLKETFLKNLKKTEEERKITERGTILQRDCSEWLELRRNLITASNFGKIIKKRETTGPSIVKSLLYKRDLSNVQSIRHGINNEMKALNQLSSQLGITIRPCGLFIDCDIPYLGATPDGLVDDNQIVEVKCPFIAFNSRSIKELVQQKKFNFFKLKDDELVINKNHDWYFQVQGQLHITKKDVCIFGIWSGENNLLKVDMIHRDDEFWRKTMVEKLKFFYLEFVLPELVDPRLTRNLQIREPPIVKKKTSEHSPTVISESTNKMSKPMTSSQISGTTDCILTFERM